jgi:alpha-tubulin suppressor-like RCC1 family protein
MCCTPCTKGFACESGTCATSCTTNADCSANHFCENNDACLGKITQIAAGLAFACSLHDDGVERCWGYNGDGEFGTAGGPRPTVVPLPMAATQIAAGNRVACAVLADTSLWCWGELNGSSASTPAPYMGLTGVKSVSLSGSVGGCAVLTSGGVECWGRNDSGQLGIGSVDTATSPAMTVPGLVSASQISHGGTDVCVLVSGGGMSCWGSNSNGQIGNGTFVMGTIQDTPDPEPSPTMVPGISGAIQVATNGVASFAVLGGSGANAGALMAWGNENYAGRGNSSGVYLTPARIGGATQFTSISPWNPACAVTSTGTVMCWGINVNGQTGAPAGATLVDPTTVPGLTGVSSVACGADFTCAVTNANLGVMCWGNDNLGQLGDGTTGTAGSNVPRAVAW